MAKGLATIANWLLDQTHIFRGLDLNIALLPFFKARHLANQQLSLTIRFVKVSK